MAIPDPCLPVSSAVGSPNVQGGAGLFLPLDCRIHGDGPVSIGDDVIVGPGVTIRAEADREVRIGARVWLGEGVQVRPGANIGPGTIVCAGTVVDREVPADAVVAGNPARVIWQLK